MPLPTDFPMPNPKRAPATCRGEAYVISNAKPGVGRAFLTIALSADGVLFDRAFVLRGDRSTPRSATQQVGRLSVSEQPGLARLALRHLLRQ